jgi:hypothetical protein
LEKWPMHACLSVDPKPRFDHVRRTVPAPVARFSWGNWRRTWLPRAGRRPLARASCSPRVGAPGIHGQRALGLQMF